MGVLLEVFAVLLGEFGHCVWIYVALKIYDMVL